MALTSQLHSFPPLALDLPSSRMSVDFSTFTVSQPQPQEIRRTKPLPNSLGSQQITRKPILRPIPLQDVQEKPEPASDASSQKSRRWPWSRQHSYERDSPIKLLSRTNSDVSTASSVSKTSTAAASVSSRSISTGRTSLASIQYEAPRTSSERKPIGLSCLPLSLLESIMEYALCLPLTVAIGPQNSERRHMQYRYHRAGLDYVDIQLIRKHPIFLVSHHIRQVALDVLNQKCDFVIDLHRIYHTKVSSTMNDNLKVYEKFWVTEKPPKMVTDTFKSLFRLNLRLPVPSCENGGHRGRDEDDWVDGSDGQGGGSWKLKSMKREQEDAARVLRCLDTIVDLVMAESTEIRGRAGTLSRTTSLKRSLSRTRSKRRGGGSDSSDSMTGEEQSKRQLRRLEVTLVKKSSHVMVLPDTLGLVKLLRAVPVSGFTKYYLELEENQVLWATKHRKKWKGFEPDGTRLLDDLQHLVIPEKPIEPIRTPTQFKFVQVDNNGKLQLSRKTMTGLERPVAQTLGRSDVFSPAARRMGLPWAQKKVHQRMDSNDSFAFMIDEGKRSIGNIGTNTSGRVTPPSVDELRKIAEDIKNGLY